MKNRLHICLVCFFLSISSFVYATHIVGGSLTYVYNGGSSYTVTLKLYRDCGPNTAGFPNSVVVNVEGYNGAAFSPGRNITINLGSISTVPPSLDPCAVAPTPMPCVQEGIYTRTVNNLPPNPGGYHMSYQVIARNLGLSNVNATCNCIGSSFYAYIPGTSVIWSEDFTLPNNTTVDNGATAWSISNVAGYPAPATARVNNNLFETTGNNNAQKIWASQQIPISSCPAFNLSINLSENGTLDPNDSILIYYRLNGGSLTPFQTNGFIRDDFNNAVASTSGLVGSTIQIVIRVHYDGNSPTSETYRFDDVIVSCNDFIPNSDPVFNLFPPIFVCVGQPFTFNHAATDADGDSLVYSFYTPHNGDNAIGGALDPTFTGNTANFTPIVWQPGYSSLNPLGGAPLTLNSSTGLLTGTAGTLGQFVVGVVVKEYRNGVYMSETLRDFQFNVVNCPQPPPPFAGTDIIVNQGCTSSMTATGYNPATVTWNSVYPGALGAYNNYLSCTTGCLNPSATGQTGAPPYVDYQICGLSSACDAASVCDTVRVIFNFTLGVTIVPQNPSICIGQTSTTLTANGSGGTPPYSYLWNSINPSQSILVGNGIYTVRVSDVSGCPPAYATVTVTSYSVAITANAGADQTVCNQIPVTTINGFVTGATGGAWSGGAGTFSPDNITLSASYSPTAAELTAGFVNLILTTTGNGSCPAAYDTVKINYVGFTGIIAVNPTPVTCFGGNNGTATVSIAGGTPPYVYSWNTAPAQSAATATGLSIGTYSVTITNGIGCISTNPVTITQPLPIANASSITHVLCSGANTGIITITTSGGIAPYAYLWSTGATTAQISGLGSQTYSVTVTDFNGCQLASVYTINEPPPIVIILTPVDVNCFNGNDGIASSTVSGGTLPYSYNWSSGATSPDAAGLQAGNYTLTITDNQGCLLANSVTIAQPTVLTAGTTSNNETCNYQDNGTATAVISGGTPGYAYLWSNGETTVQISNLTAQIYTLTVTDLKGCIATAFATITEPAALTINFISQQNVSCFSGNNGAVTANPAGGIPNYSYLWTPGGAITASLSGLTAGTYSVLVTDNSGCVDSNSVVISQPPLLSVSISQTNETCNYLNNGTAIGFPLGGIGGYTYLWQPGLQTTDSIYNLSSGTYTLTVTDTNGCTATANAIISEPAPILINFGAQTNVSCFAGTDGTVTASPTGGTPGYTYLWSNGATTSQISNLGAQLYTVTVTDSNGCFSTNSVLITQPTALSASTSKTNESCDYLNNGTATAIPTGGTAGYTYLWSTGETTSQILNLVAQTYSVTITDAKGCIANATAIITEPAPLAISFSTAHVSCFAGNDGTVASSPSGGTPNYNYSWTPGGATTASLSGLTAGIYSVIITDNSGCVDTNAVVITQPTIVSASTTTTDETCNYLNNGTATAVPAGGTPGYTYLWQPGLQTSGTISNLSSGTYTLTVTDLKGCTAVTNAVITEPLLLAITFTAQTNVSCFSGSDGTVTASPAGGTAGYTYLWNTGASTAQISNLTAQTYTATVTDSQGCVTTNSVVITQPTVLTASTSKINEICDYLNNGTATALPTGGTAGYTYLWSTGETTALISNLASQTYSVTITDAQGCTANATAIITEPAPLAISFSPTHVSCFAGSDGTVSASPSGGTPNYTYSWAPGGAITNSIFNLSAGTYSLTITDNTGCQVQNSVIITQPLAPLSVSASSLPATCFGEASGSVSAFAADGTGPYTYTWMPGSLTGQNISNLAAGTYTVTAQDSKACLATNSITVTQPTKIVLLTASLNSDCGQPNGQINVSVSGGNAPYTYLWSPSGGTIDFADSLVSGAYTVVVTDSLGCTAAQFGNVNENSAPVATIFSVTNVICYGGATGSAQVGTSGGIGPFTYSWLPFGGTDSIALGLTAGTYTVTVTDSTTGCKSLATTSPDITQPAEILITVTTSPVSCFDGNDGTASAIASGGTPGYTYQWLPGGTMGPGITGLRANTYSIEVIDTNGCIKTAPFTIVEPLSAISASLSFTPVSCFGGSDGTVSASAAGGTGPYNYTWMPGNFNGQNVSNLTAGTYTVTISDSKGCTFTDDITVTQPTLIVLTTDSINSNCSLANGQASVSASGGTGAYLYQWAPSGATNANATALFSGAYTVEVTDGNGCISLAAVTVNDNASPVATVTTTTNVSCNTGADGTATVSVAGGAGPFTYSWLPAGGTNPTATGLVPGTYTVTVTDINLCQSNPAVSAEITQPSPILITVTKSPVSCSGGSDGTASAIASGGTPGYTYQWLPGGTTGTNISNLAANTYTVEATDTNSCVQTQAFTITQPPAALSVSMFTTPVSCFAGANGTVSAAAAGGTAPYNYSWMPGNSNGPGFSNLTTGTYTVTITDIKGCSIVDSITVIQPTLIVLTTDSINSNCSLANGQASVSAAGGTGAYLYQWAPSGGTNANATALFSGAYTVEVTDGNGCISLAGVTVNDNASPVATVTATTNVSCNTGADGTATVSVAGGAGPFTYSWLPAGGTNPTAIGLVPGTYTVTVTDINLCESNPAVSAEITQPSPILITVTKSMVSCFGGNDGTASAIASGGTPGYTYQWLPGGTAGTSISNLSANTYTVQATDANSCVAILPVIITEPEPLASFISSTTHVNCNGGADGTATVTANGGTSIYNYNWLPLGGNGPTANGLSAGTYTVTVTDFKNCTTSSSVTITQPFQALSAVSTGSSTSCSGGNDGTAIINAIGGTPSYTYQWTPSVSTNDTAVGLSPGNYITLVRDSNNCKVNVSVSITQPSAINGILSFVNPSCGLSNGSASAQLSGGIFPYSYLWSFGGATTPALSGLMPGSYSLQITDAANCILPLAVNLVNIPSPAVTISSVSNVSCNGGNDGSATININQGSAPYIITWTPSGGNNLTASLLSMGTYIVNVTDAIGCQTSDSVNITEPAPVELSVTSINNVLCNGGNTGNISVTASGGTGTTYTYAWAPSGLTTAMASSLTAGTYSVTVTDQNNCVKAISAPITEPALLSSSINSITNATCFGGNGSASVLATGGVLPYSYSWSAPAVGQTGSTTNTLSAGSYTVTVTDTNGCISSSNVLITQPQQLITTAGTNDTICLGQSGILTATASGGTGSYFFIWQPSGINNSGTLAITPTANTTYTVVAYDQAGCPGTPADITAIVYTLSGADVQAISTSPICPGQISAVYVETSGTTGPLTYQWNNNLGDGPGIFLVTPAVPTTYIVTVSNVCGLSVTDSVDVLFNDQPTIALSSDPTALCALGGVQFTESSVTGNVNDPISSWFWDFGDGSSSTDQNPFHYFDQSGTFYVTLTVNTDGGCTTNNGTAPLIITAYPAPVAAFSLNSNDLLIPYDVLVCTNQSVDAASYIWNFGEGGSSTEVNPLYTYTLSGVFQVQLIATSPYGCLDTAYAEVTTNANVIFPNVFTPNTNGAPGGSYTLFDLSNDVFFPYTYGVIEYKLEIFNRWGEEIFESLDIKDGWDGYYRGQLSQQDVYVWKAYIKLNNGKVYHLNGDLTLLQ